MADNAKNALARMQAGFIKNEETTAYLESNTRSKIGGQRFVYLMVRVLHPIAKGRCVSCDQETVLGGNAMNANAATAGLLIPASMIADTDKRAGYVPGNVALFCRACVDASNDVQNNGRSFIWAADCVNAESVPREWPPLKKMRNVKYAPLNADRLTDAYLYRYRKNAAIARVKRGIIA